MNPTAALEWRWLGRCDYEPLIAAMQAFTNDRTDTTPDQLWLCEHPGVFTLGLAGKKEHLLNPGAIPVVQTDRGGQVTYHGPGQLMVYPLLDIRRGRIGIRELVTALETTIVNYCAGRQIDAESRCDAPGVYVNGDKLASVGLKIRRGASYHGLALNVDMDLEPFSRINPCGFENLGMTDLMRLGVTTGLTDRLIKDIADEFAATIARKALVGGFEHPLTALQPL